MGQTARDAERRAALRLTDDILDALERLNLRDAREVPQSVREALLDLGVSSPEHHTIAELISLVLDRQRRYLRGGGAGGERRLPSAPAGISNDLRG